MTCHCFLPSKKNVEEAMKTEEEKQKELEFVAEKEIAKHYRQIIFAELSTIKCFKNHKAIFGFCGKLVNEMLSTDSYIDDMLNAIKRAKIKCKDWDNIGGYYGAILNEFRNKNILDEGEQL